MKPSILCLLAHKLEQLTGVLELAAWGMKLVNNVGSKNILSIHSAFDFLMLCLLMIVELHFRVEYLFTQVTLIGKRIRIMF